MGGAYFIDSLYIILFIQVISILLYSVFRYLTEPCKQTIERIQLYGLASFSHLVLMFLFILEHPSNVTGNPPTSIHCMVLGSCLKVLPGTPTWGQNEQLHWTQYWRVENFGCCEAIFYAECYCREMRDGWPHPLWIVNMLKSLFAGSVLYMVVLTCWTNQLMR